MPCKMSLHLKGRLYDPPPPPKMAFASSVLPRQILPQKMPYNRLGMVMGLEPSGTCFTGPAAYDVEKKTNLLHNLLCRPESCKGYALGARLEQRPLLEKKFQTPAPNVYRAHCDPEVVAPAKKPFCHTEERFTSKGRVMPDLNPGPGTYNHNIARSCRVRFPQSFGGLPVDLPSATRKSTIPLNTEKLSTTNKELRFFRKLAYFKLYFD